MNESNDSNNETESTGEDEDCLDPFLCFPELMTRHQLLRLFKMRYFSPSEDVLVDGYEYCNLIALYNRVLLPLPQRKYGNSRKSRELAVKQKECNKRSIKRKSEEMDPTINNWTKSKLKVFGDSSFEGEVNPNAQQISNQRHDNRRQKISWP